LEFLFSREAFGVLSRLSTASDRPRNIKKTKPKLSFVIHPARH